MAKSKTQYDYYFREVEGPHLAKKWVHNFEVAKIAEDGSGLPEATYSVWGDSLDTLICGCPAAYHHAQTTCKHIGWVRRWQAILEDQKAKSNYTFTPVYYSAKNDAFYPLPTDHIEDTYEEI